MTLIWWRLKRWYLRQLLAECRPQTVWWNIIRAELVKHERNKP